MKPGLAARALALTWLQGVLERQKPLDDVMDGESALAQRDRAFAHALAATTLRRLGEIDMLLDRFLTKPPPRSAGPTRMILQMGVAQLLVMRTDPHAAIDLSVELAKADAKAKHFTGLINALLRKVSTASLEASPQRNMPEWLWRELGAAYGADTALAIAKAHMHEALLDLSVARDPAQWARALSANELPTGTVRLAAHDHAVPDLPGFQDGAWWVQDAAAALPAKLLGDVRDRSILDLCAAPGGKTAQLTSLGARVTAVDDSGPRMKRVAENLARLKFEAKLVTQDVLSLTDAESYDGVLLDAPCSATGTMRRHPDLAHLKTARQVGELATLQKRMLDRAAALVKPGGLLVYCVCSLLPSEGEAQAVSFLQRRPDFTIVPVEPAEIGSQAQFVTQDGYLRTLPHMPIGTFQGLDGFFAARFRRTH